jgi:signal transduction histidine kinase
LTTKEADQYYFYLYSLNGTEVAARAMVLSEGSQLVTLDDRQANPGIYVLVARHANRQICTKLLIQ